MAKYRLTAQTTSVLPSPLITWGEGDSPLFLAVFYLDYRLGCRKTGPLQVPIHGGHRIYLHR